MILRLGFSALALALATASYAQVRPVRLSINNNSAVVELKSNDPAAIPAHNGLSIAYFANPAARLLQLRLADPVLCASFATPVAGQVRLRLVDTNGMIQGDAAGFPGLKPLLTPTPATETGGIRYVLNPAGTPTGALAGQYRILQVATTPELKCHVFPGGASAPESEKAAQTTPKVVGVDLVTTLSVPQSARAGEDVRYTINVRNLDDGSGSVSGNQVQVRDYFPMRASDPSGPVLQTGSWTCSGTGGATCGTASGAGYVYLSNATIPPGGNVAISVTRKLDNNPIPVVNSSFRVQAAAFSRPADNEAIVTNNAAASAPIPVINNTPPAISSLAASTTTLEDQTAMLSFTVSDDDGPQALAFTFTSSNLNLVPISGITLTSTGNSRTLTIRPQDNANGVTMITVNAFDGVSTSSANFQFNVTAVNDPPSFTAPVVPDFLANPNVNTQRIINPLLGSLSFGPGETGQCLQSVVLSVRAGSADIFAPKAAPGDTNSVQIVGCTGAVLTYRLNGAGGTATIDIVATDDGGTANAGMNSATRSFTITVASAPPTISNVADQEFNEDNGLTGDSSPLLVIGPLPITLGGNGVNLDNVMLTPMVPADSVIPATALSLGGSGANRTLTITVPRHTYNALSSTVGAPTRITLTASNGAASASDTLDVRLIAVNDPPTLTVLAARDFPSPTAGASQTISNWITGLSPGPANEVTPPTGSGAQPQTIEFSSVGVDNQTGPVIQVTAQTPVLGTGGTSLQVRWVTGSVPVGAACLQATVEDNLKGPASAFGKISANGGTTPCAIDAIFASGFE